MSLKTIMTRFNKKGSYILEAVISLPVFIIAIVILCSIILMYSCIEDSNYILANEMRRAGAEAIYSDIGAALPVRVKSEIMDEHVQVCDMNESEYVYKGSRWGIDKLILITYMMELETANPLGINASADYQLSLVSRAYVGRKRNVRAMSLSEMMNEAAEPVFIFPKRGEKYHSESCGVLVAASEAATLSNEIKNKYTSCPICHSGHAGIGALVYVFPNDGEDYHLPSCPSLSRNYIELDKDVAIDRGYTACSKCGG